MHKGKSILGLIPARAGSRGLLRKNIIVHGANNSLNNILGWIRRKSENFDFTLVDNDVTKQGKKFFRRTVNMVSQLNLSNYENVFIVSLPFFGRIKEGYITRGFKGSLSAESVIHCAPIKKDILRALKKAFSLKFISACAKVKNPHGNGLAAKK